MTLVIDASVALAWLYAREEPSEAAYADRALQAATEMAIVVPSLWHTEILNALLAGERRKLIAKAQTIDYLTRLSHLSIKVDAVLPAGRQDQVMALAREHSLTAYEATYLDLALRTGAMLATFNAQLAYAMRRAGGVLLT